MISRSFLLAFLAAALAFAQPATLSKPTRGVSVSVLQGDGVIHSLPDPIESHISIRVTDVENHPIQGAVAVFELPEIGPSATLSGGGPAKVVLTDKEGAAAVTVLSNGVPGHFEPRITVNYLGQTTTLVLKQENAFSPEVRPAVYRNTLLKTGTSRGVRRGISRKRVLIIVAIATAGAVAVFSAIRGRSRTAASTAGGGITITPGSGIVGGQ